MSRNLGSFPSEPIDEKTGTNLTLMYQYLKLNKKNIYSAEKKKARFIPRNEDRATYFDEL